MKRLYALLALCIASAAPAQTTLGPAGNLGADWSAPVVATPTGSAPADAYEPAEITPQGFTATDWYDTTDMLGTAFVVTNDHTRERKFRLTCAQIGPILTQDFILGGVSHLHSPYGLQAWNGSSTYSSARFSPNSSCIGGPLFSQIYIQPLLLKVDPKTGATVGVRDQNISVYYINGQQDDPQYSTWDRRDRQMIIGPNPMDYNDTARRAVYSAAGLTYPGSPETPAGFQGFYCTLSNGGGAVVPVTLTKAQLQGSTGAHFTNYAKYFWGSGTDDDPWGGQCKSVAGVPAVIIGGLIAPQCWNRSQLKVLNGRDHMWYAASADGNPPYACPKTTGGVQFGKLPEPTFKITIAVDSAADYKGLYYSSDRMNPVGTAADPSSLDECRKVGPWFCGGSTLHADWGYGADSATFDEAQRQCLGITVRGIAPDAGNLNGAECNAGTYARYKTLKYGVSPNPALSAGCATFLGCFDAKPSRPKDYLIAVPKMASGTTKVHRMPGM